MTKISSRERTSRSRTIRTSSPASYPSSCPLAASCAFFRLDVTHVSVAAGFGRETHDEVCGERSSRKFQDTHLFCQVLLTTSHCASICLPPEVAELVRRSRRASRVVGAAAGPAWEGVFPRFGPGPRNTGRRPSRRVLSRLRFRAQPIHSRMAAAGSVTAALCAGNRQAVIPAITVSTAAPPRETASCGTVSTSNPAAN